MHWRLEADGSRTEVQGLLDPGPRVVQERQEGVIPLPFEGRAIRLGQDGRHLLHVQVADLAAGAPFRGNAQHGRTLGGGQGLTIGDKGEETAQGRQATVTRGDRDVAFLLKILQKRHDLSGGQMQQVEVRHRTGDACGDEP